MKKIKPIYFNLENEKELFEYAESLPNFSKWAKNALLREMYSVPMQSRTVPVVKEIKVSKNFF